MSKSLKGASLALSLALFNLACGEDTETPAVDAGMQMDGGTSMDMGSKDSGTVDMGGSDAGSQGPLEIIGIWASNFGGEETISDSHWNQDSLVSYDNELNYVITQSSTSAQFNPGKFNKLVWTEPSENSFYYCFVDFGLDTAEAAKNTSKMADTTDPANSGCGGFAWTKLFEPLEVKGIYASNFGMEEIVTSTSWDHKQVVNINNEQNYVVTQNGPDDMFNPSKFNKLVWTELSGDSFYYCFVDFGLDTAEAAEMSTKMADATDPENSGCGGFAWTKLTRAVSIRGNYLSNFASMETITATVWRTDDHPAKLIEWNESERWLITQNSPDFQFGPDKYNRIEWTKPNSSGSFYYCFVDFGLDTLTEAQQSTNSADPSDPENSGCGNFPWTRLDRR